MHIYISDITKYESFLDSLEKQDNHSFCSANAIRPSNDCLEKDLTGQPSTHAKGWISVRGDRAVIDITHRKIGTPHSAASCTTDQEPRTCLVKAEEKEQRKGAKERSEGKKGSWVFIRPGEPLCQRRSASTLLAARRSQRSRSHLHRSGS